MRLIDADTLNDYVMDIWGGGNIDNTVIWYGDVFEAIHNAPTIDAVPLVRCKDCRKFAPYSDKFKNEYPDSEDGACMMLTMCVYEWQDAGRYNDDYCSRGERKEANND